MKSKVCIWAGLLLILLSGCKKEVESVSVKPLTIMMAIGEQYPLTADVQPEKAPQEVEWYTTDPHVASVDENGVVTALGIGVCNINLYAGTAAAVCQVTVIRQHAEHFFTVNFRGDKVRFSPGNLQYRASTNSWRFAEHSFDNIGDGGETEGNVPGSNNLLVSMFYDGWIDQFCWATSGWHDERDELNRYYHPWDYRFEQVPTPSGSLYYGFGPSGSTPDMNLTGSSARYDWGVYNSIYNPQTGTTDSAGTWRLLTADERDYLIFYRTTSSGVRFSRAVVHGVDGFVFFPDDWDISIHFFKDPNITSGVFTKNVLEDNEWLLCEAEGCVFLPCMGALWYENSGHTYWMKHDADYWTSSVIPEKSHLVHAMFAGPNGRLNCKKAAVRLVSMLP